MIIEFRTALLELPSQLFSLKSWRSIECAGRMQVWWQTTLRMEEGKTTSEKVEEKNWWRVWIQRIKYYWNHPMRFKKKCKLAGLCNQSNAFFGNFFFESMVNSQAEILYAKLLCHHEQHVSEQQKVGYIVKRPCFDEMMPSESTTRDGIETNVCEQPGPPCLASLGRAEY